MPKKRDLKSDPATKADLKALAKAFDYKLNSKLRKNTNTVIEELSRDIRTGNEKILGEIRSLREDLKPRVTILENKQNALNLQVDDHEERIKKLEVSAAA